MGADRLTSDQVAEQEEEERASTSSKQALLQNCLNMSQGHTARRSRMCQSPACLGLDQENRLTIQTSTMESNTFGDMRG